MDEHRRWLATDQEVAEALAALSDASAGIRAADWRRADTAPALPGLYSWWVDAGGARDLTEGLGHHVSAGRIYAGQSGATKWPSGHAGKATLRSRVGGNHLSGRIRGSTFRFTLAAALANSLELQPVGPKRLSAESEARLTRWMAGHLSVVLFPFEDPDPLGNIERRVLDELDPPLNLEGRRPNELRAQLSRLRAALNKPNVA